jgi:cell division protein FtsA
VASEQVVVGLDVGTTKICTLIGEVKGPRQIEVVGVGISPSRGLKKGLIVDMDEAAVAIATSIRKAETYSGYRIIGGFVALSGGHIDSEIAHGIIRLPGDRAVSRQELKQVEDASRLEDFLEGGRHVLHVMPMGYIVDGESGVQNPVGMRATTLEAESLVVTSAISPLQNLARCIERAGLQIDGFVASGLASSHGVLTDTEKQLGVLLMDIGGGTTDLVWYREGEVEYVAALPIGGNHLTNDLAVGLGVPFSAAEEMKVRFASAVPDNVEPNETIEADSFSDGEPRKISRRFMAEIVEARLSEIFSLVQEELSRHRFEGVLPGGIVMTGGTAQLRGVRELVELTFHMPARVGHPDGLIGTIESITTPGYATGAGLLKWVVAQSGDGVGSRQMRKRVDWGSRLKGIVKIFFP